MTTAQFPMYDESQYGQLWDHHDSTVELDVAETLELLISVDHLASCTATLEGLIQVPS